MHARFSLAATALLIASTVSIPTVASSAIPSISAASLPAIGTAPVRPTGELSVTRLDGIGVTKPLSDAAVRDITDGAAQAGLLVEDVLATHAGIEQFNQAVSDIEIRFPKMFVRAGVAKSSTESNWIMLTEALPDAALQELSRALPMDVDLITGAPASSTELAATSARLAGAIAAAPLIFRAGGTRYDRDAQVIRLDYELVTGLSGDSAIVSQALNRVLESAATGAPDGALPLPVVPVRVDDGGISEATVAGGRGIFFSGTNTLACTSGFSAVRNGNRAIVTADHCPNTGHYNNVAGVISTSPVQGGPGFGSSDLQWHRTLTENGHSTSSTFRASASEANRQVTSVVNPPVDQYICHWGEMSGTARCSTISAVDECWTYADYGTACGLDTVRGDISEGGDSGGPWFLGNMAHGIHKGKFNGNSQYTRIGRVSLILGAQVLTN